MKNKIKETREKIGMSQEQLSKESNVSRTIISGLENGTLENTTSLTMEKIAIALNKTIEQLFFSN